MSETAALLISLGIGFTVGLLTRLSPREDWEFLSEAGLIVIVVTGGLAGAIEKEIHIHDVDGPEIWQAAVLTWDVCLGILVASFKHSLIELAAVAVGWLLAWFCQRAVRIYRG